MLASVRVLNSNPGRRLQPKSWGRRPLSPGLQLGPVAAAHSKSPSGNAARKERHTLDPNKSDGSRERALRRYESFASLSVPESSQGADCMALLQGSLPFLSVRFRRQGSGFGVAVCEGDQAYVGCQCAGIQCCPS